MRVLFLPINLITMQYILFYVDNKLEFTDKNDDKLIKWALIRNYIVHGIKPW